MMNLSDTVAILEFFEGMLGLAGHRDVLPPSTAEVETRGLAPGKPCISMHFSQGKAAVTLTEYELRSIKGEIRSESHTVGLKARKNALIQLLQTQAWQGSCPVCVSAISESRSHKNFG